MKIYDKENVINKEAFAERLLTLRKGSKLTQAAVAQKIGVQKLAYGNYERGSRLPDIEKLYSLAKLFAVSLDYLLGYKLDNFNSAKQFWESRGFKVNTVFKSEKIELLFSFREAPIEDKEGNFNVPSEITKKIFLQNEESFINLTQEINNKCKPEIYNYEKKIIIDSLKKMKIF